MSESATKTAAHTPGPWRWFGNGGALVGDHGRRPVVLCGVLGATGEGSPGAGLGQRDPETGLLAPLDTTSPDALLIQAAPDLLAACHKALGDLSTLAQDGPRARLCEIIRTAIAKAEGGAA